MKKIFVATLLFISNFSYSQVFWNNSSFVHRNGTQINDGLNNPIQLEGVNLGGWLMWEGWIWNGGFTQQKTIFNTIESQLGTTAANNFRDSVYWNYITEKDIKHISEQCYNVVRIPFNHYLLEDDFTPYVYKPEGWEILDSILAWCERYNIYAVLDLHSAPGGQSNLFTADPDIIINLWNGSINQTRTASLWKAIANRYQNRGIIAGYDLLNEPDPTNDNDMLNLYQRIIDSIRTVDTNHMLFIEGSQLATDFNVFASLPDPNMTFEFHIYTWFITDIPAEVQQYTTLSQNLNVPVWCGEWGENSYEELDTTLKIFRDPTFGISGSAFWTWKKLKRNTVYPDLLDADTTALWNKTIQWIGNNLLPLPTVTEMQTGIDEFIQNIKWENCNLNDSLNNILTNCSTISIDEININDNSFHLFPNPTNGRFVVAFDSKYDLQTVKVRNYNGELIKIVNVLDNQNNSIEIVGPTGIYFIECISTRSTKVLKLVLIK